MHLDILSATILECLNFSEYGNIVHPKFSLREYVFPQDIFIERHVPPAKKKSPSLLATS